MKNILSRTKNGSSTETLVFSHEMLTYEIEFISELKIAIYALANRTHGGGGRDAQERLSI